MKQIETINFYNKDLSRIVFGAAAISGEGGGYGFGDISEADTGNLIAGALDLGINIFDTAPIYGFNHSEIQLGQHLQKVREDVFIISKAGVTWHENMRVDMSNRPEVITRMLENSLRNINSDYIDLYMIHWPDKNVDIRFPLEVLAKAKLQGRIKHIGLCNTNLEDLVLSSEICKVEFVQSECNLFNNAFTQLDKHLKQKKILKMGWGTLDKGILTGNLKGNTQFDKTDCRSWAPWWKKSNWREKVKKVESYNANISVKDLAVQYSKENVDFSICGGRKLSHYEDIISIYSKAINANELAHATEFLRG